MQRDARPAAEALPDPHLQGLGLQARDGERSALLRRPDRQVLRPVLGPGHDRGAPRQRRPLRRLHAEPGPADPRRPQPSRCSPLRPCRTTRPPRAGATSCRPRRAFFEKSAVVLGAKVDLDVFGIDHDELAAAVHLFIVRGGRVRGVHSWTVDKELDVPLGDLVDSVAAERVRRRADARPRGRRARAARRRRGARDAGSARWPPARCGFASRTAATRRRCSRRPTQNARQSLMLYKTRRSADFTTRSRALEDIQEALGMADAPLRIECFDVSHLSGTNIVASMVVFEDGLPRKDEYRRFTIPSSSDDTDSIHQVLTRRLAYLAKPDRDDRAATTADDGRPGAGDGESADAAASHRAPEEVRVPPEPPRRRRRRAAGRSGGTRPRGVRRRRASTCAASPSGSRRSGRPTPTSR